MPRIDIKTFRESIGRELSDHDLVAVWKMHGKGDPPPSIQEAIDRETVRMLTQKEEADAVYQCGNCSGDWRFCSCGWLPF